MVTQQSYHPVTLYMNDRFVEDYFKPFLVLILTTKKVPQEGIKVRVEKGVKVVTSESSAVRALIKYFVDYHKKREAIKTKTEEVVTKSTEGKE